MISWNSIRKRKRMFSPKFCHPDFDSEMGWQVARGTARVARRALPERPSHARHALHWVPTRHAAGAVHRQLGPTSLAPRVPAPRPSRDRGHQSQGLQQDSLDTKRQKPLSVLKQHDVDTVSEASDQCLRAAVARAGLRLKQPAQPAWIHACSRLLLLAKLWHQTLDTVNELVYASGENEHR